jgi:hypothetical protein
MSPVKSYIVATHEIIIATIDVIGDIHGYADKLRKLLGRLGYEQTGGVSGVCRSQGDFRR